MRKKILPLLILIDLIKNYKLILFLLCLVFITAQALIWTTHENRRLLNEKTQLILAKDGLEREYQSFILELSTLTNDYIIENKAKSLGLVPIDENETVIIIE